MIIFKPKVSTSVRPLVTLHVYLSTIIRKAIKTRYASRDHQLHFCQNDAKSKLDASNALKRCPDRYLEHDPNEGLHVVSCRLPTPNITDNVSTCATNALWGWLLPASIGLPFET